MKKTFIILIFFSMSSNVFGFSLFGSKLDGVWNVDMEEMMLMSNNQKNETLNHPMFGEIFQNMFASAVLVIKNDTCFIIFGGEVKESVIEKISKQRFKMNEIEIMFLTVEGTEYLVWEKKGIKIIMRKLLEI